uniref:Uncharacterized protein n=1 Tax=Picea glauca TaxID=3330 RepID=A0A101LXK7_PICGL|nr:hypothetical protein ABT39_MTgene1718 [Picea glauca]KUM47216.1 hypothetical protein ABT39_MTgene6222 [Picea glauca]KUM49729.1 hypothetical protein ABT39_MTgene2956 [Picea glauca]QHR87359.1 hypothetical protein Q903MT_gene1369 [Picea sitchensis]
MTCFYWGWLKRPDLPTFSIPSRDEVEHITSFGLNHSGFKPCSLVLTMPELLSFRYFPCAGITALSNSTLSLGIATPVTITYYMA